MGLSLSLVPVATAWWSKPWARYVATSVKLFYWWSQLRMAESSFCLYLCSVNLTAYGRYFILAECSCWAIWVCLLQCNLDYPDLIYPEPRLSRLAWDPQIHYYACTEGMADEILGGVATVEQWPRQFYWLVLAKTDWPVYFYEHCWPWSCYIGIV